MAKKVVKITINHYNSTEHLSTTTATKIMPISSHIITQGRNTTVAYKLEVLKHFAHWEHILLRG